MMYAEQSEAENFLYLNDEKLQNIIKIICRAKRGNKNMKKLARVQKYLIMGPQNLGSRGVRAPTPPLGSASARIRSDEQRPVL